MNRFKITHVAIIFQGVTYSLPAPNRHWNVMQHIASVTGAESIDADVEGFLDEEGNFLNRKQALVSAILFDQVKDRNNIKMHMLFSEDLW